ncbi:MAG: pyridoxal 5'-phosphate synthase glutaminase subunit PdxT [Candidatus Woesearchaeota archaeon]|nr:pyridoxal 5'-phosphate synthase glutaminase subunit PdxT [Candidatus Woesearchaeota archaeon]
MIGILALQGDYDEHKEVLDSLHANNMLVKTPEDLEKVKGLIMPGGESTVQGMLLEETGLANAIFKRAKKGMPIFATCAGAILLANKVIGGEKWLRLVDMTIERNAYGRQYESFNEDISIENIGVVHGAFIRAPIIKKTKAKVLATFKDNPVVIQQDSILVTTFHPEICDEKHVHEYFVKMVK